MDIKCADCGSQEIDISFVSGKEDNIRITTMCRACLRADINMPYKPPKTKQVCCDGKAVELLYQILNTSYGCDTYVKVRRDLLLEVKTFLNEAKPKEVK